MIAHGLAEDIADVDHAHLCARHAGNFEGGKRAAGVFGDFDIDLFIRQFAVAQFGAEFLPCLLAGILADQRIQYPFLGMQFGFCRDFLAHLLARHMDGDFHQIAHDLFDVASDIADLGKFGRLYFEERRLCQARQATCDLGFAWQWRPSAWRHSVRR